MCSWTAHAYIYIYILRNRSCPCQAPHILCVLRANSATSFVFVCLRVCLCGRASVTARFSMYMHKYVYVFVCVCVCVCSQQHAYLSIFPCWNSHVCPCTPYFAPFEVAQRWHCQPAARLQFWLSPPSPIFLCPFA